MPEKLYSISDAARILRVSRQTIYNWIDDGVITPVLLKNDRQCISQSTLDHLLKNILPAEKRVSKTTNYLLYNEPRS